MRVSVRGKTNMREPEEEACGPANPEYTVVTTIETLFKTSWKARTNNHTCIVMGHRMHGHELTFICM